MERKRFLMELLRLLKTDDKVYKRMILKVERELSYETYR